MPLIAVGRTPITLTFMTQGLLDVYGLTIENQEFEVASPSSF